MEPALLDTDTLSEIMKGVDPHVQDHARRYLAVFRHFTFSIITRYEILRGLKAVVRPARSRASNNAVSTVRCCH